MFAEQKRSWQAPTGRKLSRTSLWANHRLGILYFPCFRACRLPSYRLSIRSPEACQKTEGHDREFKR